MLYCCFLILLVSSCSREYLDTHIFLLFWSGCPACLFIPPSSLTSQFKFNYWGAEQTPKLNGLVRRKGRVGVDCAIWG